MTEYIPGTRYCIRGVLKNCEELELTSIYKFIGKIIDPDSAKEATQWLEMASNDVLSPNTELRIIPHDEDEGCVMQASTIKSCTITDGKYNIITAEQPYQVVDLQKIIIEKYDPFAFPPMPSFLFHGREVTTMRARILPPSNVQQKKD